MTRDPAWRRYLRFWNSDPAGDVDDELQHHLQARVDEFVARGMDPTKARAAAEARFGDVADVRARTLEIETRWARERSIAERLGGLASDFRHAARRLRRAPTLTAAGVLCFALGIGANTAIYSVVDAVLFRPLSFDDAGLVILGEQLPAFAGSNYGTISAPEYLDYKTLNGRTFAASGIFENDAFVLTGEAGPERVAGAVASASLFDVLGVRAVHGRTFLPDEDASGASKVVVLSDELWRGRFNADPNIVDRSMTIDGGSFRIVGVLPPGFAFPIPGIGDGVAQLFVPYPITPDVEKSRGNAYNTTFIARLAKGVTFDRAKHDVAEIARRLPERHPGVYGPAQVTLADLFPLRERAVGGVRRSLFVLLAAVGFVLLIACINISNLLVARAASRRHELALRRALGASRGRVLREFLAESTLIVVAGTALGVILSIWSARMLAADAPDALLQGYRVSLDARVLFVTALAAAFTAFVVSLYPAAQSRDRALDAVLREDSRAAAGASSQRGRQVLVVAQIALAVIVATAAGLMVRSFVNARSVDPGFDASHLLTFRLAVPDYRYRTTTDVESFERDMTNRLARLPGVRAAGAATSVPMAGTWHISVTPENVSVDKTPIVLNTMVYPGFFDAMGLPIRTGQPFSGRETRQSPPVVVINEAFARRFYRGVNPIGRRLKWGSAQSTDPWATVVGVAANVQQVALDTAAEPAVYFPALQQDTSIVLGGLRDLAYVVRADGEPSALLGEVRRAVHAQDAGIPIVKLSTFDEVVAASVSGRRFNTILLVSFTALALVLASVGIYGLMAFTIVQRTREIGIRLAMGATGSNVLALVVGQAVRLAVFGASIGVVGALALTRVMRSLLFGVSPSDPWTLVGATGLLLAIAALAACVPAFRASRIDPKEAIVA